MFYKPRFCCHCGEKIEKTDWEMLDSRRFCTACSTEHRATDYIVRAIVAAGTLGFVYGIGSWLIGSNGSLRTTGGQDHEKPIQVAAQPTLRPPKSGPRSPTDANASQNEEQAEQQQQAQQPEPSTKPSPKRSAQPSAFCGALTKKGTPCSRKVKQAGTRCFQHEGKPAAAEQE